MLFVGNSRGVYRYAVRSALAIGADLTLHGTDWTEFVERDQIASGGVANEEVGVLYASAGIVLNDHHLDMRRDSFASNRLFDAAACWHENLLLNAANLRAAHAKVESGKVAGKLVSERAVILACPGVPESPHGCRRIHVGPQARTRGSARHLRPRRR